MTNDCLQSVNSRRLCPDLSPACSPREMRGSALMTSAQTSLVSITQHFFLPKRISQLSLFQRHFFLPVVNDVTPSPAFHLHE